MNLAIIFIFFSAVCAVDVEKRTNDAEAITNVFRNPLFIKTLHKQAGKGAFTEFAATRKDVRDAVLAANEEPVLFRKAMSSAMRDCPGSIFHLLHRAVNGEHVSIKLDYLNLLQERCITAVENVCVADRRRIIFKGAFGYLIPMNGINQAFLRLSQVCKVSLELHSTAQLQQIPPGNVYGLYLKSKLSAHQEEVLRTYLTTCDNLAILDLHEVELSNGFATAIPSKLRSFSHGNSNGHVSVYDDSGSWDELFTRLEKLAILRKFSISRPPLSDATLNKLPRALQLLSFADEPNLKLQHLAPLRDLVSLKNSKLSAVGQTTLPRSLKELDLEGLLMEDNAFVLDSFTMEAIQSSSLRSLSLSYLNPSAETLNRIFAVLPISLRRVVVAHNELSGENSIRTFDILPGNSLEEIVFAENGFGTQDAAQVFVNLLRASRNLVTLTIDFTDNNEFVPASLREFIIRNIPRTIKEFKVKDPGELLDLTLKLEKRVEQE